jgi:2-iminobutanoate/2-iminopropanoate deaminase
MSQNLQVIRTELAPTPVGPYNQAIAVPATSQLLFMAGQIAIDPATSKAIEGDVTAQTERVLQNVKAVLNAAGADFVNVVKTTVFLADMADFPAMNLVYAKYFLDPAPARSTIQVARLPLDVLVEIECIAAI